MRNARVACRRPPPSRPLESNTSSDTENLRSLLTEFTKDGKLPSPHSLGLFLGQYRGKPLKDGDRTWVLDRVSLHGADRWTVREAKNPNSAPLVVEVNDSPPDDSTPF